MRVAIAGCFPGIVASRSSLPLLALAKATLLSQCIARFITALDPQIPYALLGFAPQFYMADLPCTSLRHAQEAEAAARAAGLTHVCVANRGPLGWEG